MYSVLMHAALGLTTPIGGLTVKLNNGLDFPIVSFGLQVYDDDTAEAYTKIAIQSGIRNFFSSVLANNQNGFGRAIANVTSGPNAIKRSDIFICGSVNTGGGACSGKADCQTQTAAGCTSNLQAINQPYLDMIMLDYPAGDCDSIQGACRARGSLHEDKPFTTNDCGTCDERASCTPTRIPTHTALLSPPPTIFTQQGNGPRSKQCSQRRRRRASRSPTSHRSRSPASKE